MKGRCRLLAVFSQEDELIFNNAIRYFFQYNYSVPDLPTYQEMKSNGQLGLIYNLDLRNQLISFESTTISVNNIFDSMGNAIQSKLEIYDKYIRTGVDPETYEISFESDFKGMSSDEEFINHFSRLAQQWRGSAFFNKNLNDIAIRKLMFK